MLAFFSVLRYLFFKGDKPEVWDSAFGKECNKVAFWDQTLLQGRSRTTLIAKRVVDYGH